MSSTVTDSLVETQGSRALSAAVHRLVDSFSLIPTRWIQELAHSKENYITFPMWGTLFMPSDPCDARRIDALCRAIECEDDGDLQELRDSGWRAVGDTGVLAIFFEDELLLGIHGAGYDFYEAHWSPLYQALDYRYQALDYRWHL